MLRDDCFPLRRDLDPSEYSLCKNMILSWPVSRSRCPAGFNSTDGRDSQSRNTA